MLTDSSANGVIASFARHPTAANLIIALMVVCGLYAITNINRQFFPDFGIEEVDLVTPEFLHPRAADAGLAGGQEFDAGAARQAQALLGHLAFDELGEWLAREEIA